ncbi:DUF190 domain-containing protein [bacterium]|nr:DUF190 domain-containing protein [bacterium]
MSGPQEMVLLRIYLGEADRYKGRPMYQALVEALREHGIAGATVLRGLMGYGAHSTMHTSALLDLSSDLPIVIEAIDSAEQVEYALEKLRELGFDPPLLTTEKVQAYTNPVRDRK